MPGTRRYTKGMLSIVYARLLSAERFGPIGLQNNETRRPLITTPSIPSSERGPNMQTCEQEGCRPLERNGLEHKTLRGVWAFVCLQLPPAGDFRAVSQNTGCHLNSRINACSLAQTTRRIVPPRCLSLSRGSELLGVFTCAPT